MKIARLLLGAVLALVSVTNALAIAPATKAPDFTLRTMDGPNMRLQEQRGRVVLMNRLYEKYKSSGFVILGVNVDEDPKNAAGVAAKLGVKFPVLWDTDKNVSKLYELSTMPSTVLIDRDGKVRFIHRGYLSGYEETYDKQIRELLKE